MRQCLPLPTLSAVLFILCAPAAFGQSWLDIVKDKATQRAERYVNQTIDKGLGAAEGAIKCVATDRACIDNAQRAGKEVVLTKDSGNPLPPDRQPPSAAPVDTPGAADAASTAAVPPTPAGVRREVQVATSSGHTLVVAPDGTVLAQGLNDYGQVSGSGPSDGVGRLSPVFGVPRALAVATGDRSYSLVLGEDGKVYAWGRHDFGILGGDRTGVENKREHPTPVANLGGVIGIAGCYRAAAALRHDGTVWMWGEDRDGIMGSGKLTEAYTSGDIHFVPTRVQGLADVVQIACGYDHMLALQRDGTVWAWGLNERGQLGVGDLQPRARPTRIPLLSGVSHIAAASSASVARLTDGSWRIWGDAGPAMMKRGRDQASPPMTVPAPPPGLQGVRDFAVGVAVLGDGTVRTWGDNTFGRLCIGQGPDTYASQPVLVRSLSAITHVWGYSRVLALGADGTLHLCGPSGNGRGGTYRAPVAIGRLAVEP
jgi:alpha-tubulin suppressor-like RCC1 family protein